MTQVAYEHDILRTLRAAILPDKQGQVRARAAREMNLAFAEAMLATGAAVGDQMTGDELRDIARHIQSDRALLARFRVSANLSGQQPKPTAAERRFDLSEEADADNFVFLNTSEARQQVLDRLTRANAPDPEVEAGFEAPAGGVVFKSRRSGEAQSL